MNSGGRPPLHGERMSRVTVYLTPDQVLEAHRIGHGNLSHGLRQQLRDLADVVQAHRLRAANASSSPTAEPRRRHQ